MQLTIFFCILSLYQSLPVDDPSQWPGHLEKFGSQQKMVELESEYYWPSPEDFFRRYVDKTRAMIFRGVYKYSKAIHEWNDEYMTDKSKTSDERVFFEPNIKENRSADGNDISFRKFLQTYHNKPIQMVSTVPKSLMKDVLLPSPLICNETAKHLVNVMMLFGQGNMKSVVHNDDVETIQCAFQGPLDAFLIEYTQNKNYVIDRPEGGYSSLDVDRVDYVKYPLLRKVDKYYNVHLNEGDCVYIPYRWYKQLNGAANHEGRNIGFQVWFNHLHDHKPSDCEIRESEATLDKFDYFDVRMRAESQVYQAHKSAETAGHHEKGGEEENQDQEQEQEEQEEQEEKINRHIIHFHTYLRYSKKKKNRTLSFEKFYSILKKDESLSSQSHKNLVFPKTFEMLASELFGRLDVNNDTILSRKDFKEIRRNDEKRIVLSKFLEFQTARIEDYVEDLVEAKHHDEPIHLFEERMMEKFRLMRKFEL